MTVFRVCPISIPIIYIYIIGITSNFTDHIEWCRRMFQIFKTSCFNAVYNMITDDKLLIHCYKTKKQLLHQRVCKMLKLII